MWGDSGWWEMVDDRQLEEGLSESGLQERTSFREGSRNYPLPLVRVRTVFKAGCFRASPTPLDVRTKTL